MRIKEFIKHPDSVNYEYLVLENKKAGSLIRD